MTCQNYSLDNLLNQCSQCSSAFARKSGLTRHIGHVHEGKKRFQCSACGATFYVKSKLDMHIATVHEKQKPFQCDICKKRFTSKAYGCQTCCHCS